MNWLIQVANKTNVEVSEVVASANSDNYEQIAWEIINRYCIYKSNYAFAEKKVLELYDEEMEFQESIPSVDEIMNGIDSFNALQIDRAVEVMMKYDNGSDLYFPEEAFEDRSAMFFDYFYSTLEYDPTNIFDEEDVAGLLMKNNKTYILSYDDPIYTDISVLGDAEYADVIVNDCQESILPEFNLALQMIPYIGEKALFLYNSARMIKKKSAIMMIGG